MTVTQMGGKPVHKKLGVEGRPVRRIASPQSRDEKSTAADMSAASSSITSSDSVQVQEQSVIASTGYEFRRQQKGFGAAEVGDLELQLQGRLIQVKASKVTGDGPEGKSGKGRAIPHKVRMMEIPLQVPHRCTIHVYG